MRSTRKYNCFFKALFFLLLVSLLLSAVACNPKTPNDDPEGKEVPETMTNLTIGGKSIANHVIVYSGEDNSPALTIRSAVSNFANVTPAIKSEMPENGKAIWLKVDSQQSPASCRVYVEGERTLVLAVHMAEFIDDVVALFKEQLTGETLDFPQGYSVSRNYEAVPYQSATKVKKLVGDADKSPISYAVGENAAFTIAAVAGNQLLSIPYFHVETWNEATGTKTDRYMDGANGYIVAYIGGSATQEHNSVEEQETYFVQDFNEAGYFYFKVNACDENKNKIASFSAPAEESYQFVGAIGFGIEELEPAAETPADFDAYWDIVVNEVKSKNFADQPLTKISGKAGYLTYYWQTPTGGKNAYKEDNVAAGYLTVPVTASESNKIGLKICFRGYDGSIPIESPSWQENTAVLVVSSHSFDQEKAKADSNYYTKQKILIGENYVKIDYFREMIKRDLFGARFLIEYFGDRGNNYWDGVTFEVSGGSMGAMQSTAVAALTKQVTGVDVGLLNIGIPWMCDVNATAIGRRPRSWPSDIANFGYFDEANFAHLITCNVKIYAALGDKTCPASGVTVFYNQLHCEKSITFEQNTSHGGGVGGGKYTLSASN